MKLIVGVATSLPASFSLFFFQSTVVLSRHSPVYEIHGNRNSSSVRLWVLAF